MSTVMQSSTPSLSDPLLIDGIAYRSRLLVGTGKYKDMAETRAATEASGAEIVTVAIRRTNIGQDPNEMMDKTGYKQDRGGRIIVDQETLETNVPEVFAGGDIIANTDGTVIFAAGCGLRAAHVIADHLA